MPIENTQIGCPVCGRPLTDLDGLLECQNSNEPHFSIGYGQPYFNFSEWSKRQHKVTRPSRIPKFAKEPISINI